MLNTRFLLGESMYLPPNPTGYGGSTIDPQTPLSDRVQDVDQAGRIQLNGQDKI